MVKVPFLGGAGLPVVPLAAAAAALVVVAVAAAWLWSGHSARPRASTHHHTKVKTQVTGSVVTLAPESAAGFDPLTSRKDDPGNENTQYAQYAIDSDPRTAWDSQWYKSDDFGHLKAGSGLMIEMSKPVTFRSVSVLFGSAQPGADVKLLVGNSAARSAANLDSMTTVASARDVSGTWTFRISGTATGRFLVIWFTKLPPKPGHGHWFMAEVFNVVIRGISSP